MQENKTTLIDPLIKSGNVFKLKCEKCKSISVQITQDNKPDLTCFECGGSCNILK